MSKGAVLPHKSSTEMDGVLVESHFQIPNCNSHFGSPWCSTLQGARMAVVASPSVMGKERNFPWDWTLEWKRMKTNSYSSRCEVEVDGRTGLCSENIAAIISFGPDLSASQRRESKNWCSATRRVRAEAQVSTHLRDTQGMEHQQWSPSTASFPSSTHYKCVCTAEQTSQQHLFLQGCSPEHMQRIGATFLSAQNLPLFIVAVK